MDSVTPTTHIDLEEETAFIDVITIDMFNVVIPIFVDAGEMLHALDQVCVDVDTTEADFVFDGMACLYKDIEGAPVFAVYLHPGSTGDVWVHEASHLVDMVFETMGIFTGYESTETRAYMLQHIFRSIATAMSEYREKQLTLETKDIVH